MDPTPDRQAPDPSVYAVTQEGLEELQRELDELRRLKHGSVAAELREARSFGAAEGNDELWAIREEEAILDARIARLAEVIARARVAGGDSAAETVAGIGSVVEVEDVAAGTTASYRIVGVHDISSEGGVRPVSAASPVGRALLGQSEGARVTAELPSGERREYRLVRVAPSRGDENLRAAS